MSGSNQSMVELAHARVGTTLRGKWHLEQLLGVGGMAAVYRGTHRNGARGAIKILHLAVSLDAEARKRFLREGYVANAVEHPGAVRVLDDDVTEEGSAFLVMELLDGESLDALCERRGGKLTTGEVLAFADRLLDVIGAAHQKGIVHRDIKPDNVFLTRDGTLKLLDFGIARLRDGSSSVTMTADGAAFGTPAFMAPEQALGRTDQIDARSDIFSIGATMFSLLSGRLVHVTRTINEQLVAQASRPPPLLASVAPEVPAAVAAVVDRALAFEKAARWPDARTMRDAIRGAQQALGAGPLVVGAAPPPVPVAVHTAQATVAPSVRDTRRTSSGPGSVLAGVVAGALCVLGAVALVLNHYGRPGAAHPAAASPASPAYSASSDAPAPLASASPTTVAATTASTPLSAVTSTETPKPPAQPVTMGETPKPPAQPVTMGETPKPPAQPVTMGETPKPPAQPVTMGETPKPPAQPVKEPAAAPTARPAASPHPPPAPKKAPARPGGDNWLDRQH